MTAVNYTVFEYFTHIYEATGGYTSTIFTL